MEIDFSDVETFGEPDESGRPANIPEKFWRAGEGEETSPSVDLGSLVKEYNYRSKQLGAADGLIGAPEAYEKPDYKLPEGVEYELKDDDPLLTSFSQFAKERNLSQKAYGDIVSFYVEQQAQQQAADKAFIEQEIEKLGPNGKGKEMIQQMNQQVENWTKDLPEAEREEVRQGYKDALATAASYKFLSFMQKQMQPSKLPDSSSQNDSQLTRAKVQEMQAATFDDGPNKGRRRYDIDPEYRKAVREAWKSVVGEGEYKREVSLPR